MANTSNGRVPPSSAMGCCSPYNLYLGMPPPVLPHNRPIMNQCAFPPQFGSFLLPAPLPPTSLSPPSLSTSSGQCSSNLTPLPMSGIAPSSSQDVMQSYNLILDAKNENQDSDCHENGDADNEDDKSAMLKIAQLARFNKVHYQYKLLDERGPAHEKIFTVTLAVGDEEYTSEGPSIKKAQQTAAVLAWEETSLTKPQSRGAARGPKHPKERRMFSSTPPTVQLNTIAHKLGLQPRYNFLDPPIYTVFPTPCYGYGFGPRPYFRHGVAYPTTFPVPQPLFTVRLRLGDHVFEGRGLSRQAARNQAALQALAVQKQLELANAAAQRRSGTENNPVISPGAVMGLCFSTENLSNFNEVCPQNVSLDVEAEDEFEKQAGMKSPVSLVHEMALQFKGNVEFQLTNEYGPAHLRMFAMKCMLVSPEHQLTAEGHGTSKKLAKQHACELLIEQMKKLEGPLPVPGLAKKLHEQYSAKKNGGEKVSKRNNIVKACKLDPSYGQQINPITRLIQIQQVQNAPEPIFTFIRESGQARYKEFLIQVTVGDLTCDGVGPNKKLAKRNAAEAMLDLMGFSKPLPKPGKSVIKVISLPRDNDLDHEDIVELAKSASQLSLSASDVGQNEGSQSDERKPCYGGRQRKVTFCFGDERDNPSDPHVEPMPADENELKPGQALQKVTILQQINHDDSGNGYKGNADVMGCQHQAAALAKEFLLQPQIGKSPAQQLLNISEFLSIHIYFTDKQAHSQTEYLSIVTVDLGGTTSYHGKGPTIEDARNQAAQGALEGLAKMGMSSSDGGPALSLSNQNSPVTSLGHQINQDRAEPQGSWDNHVENLASGKYTRRSRYGWSPKMDKQNRKRKPRGDVAQQQ